MPLFFAKFRTIVLAMVMLIVGKVAVMAAVGRAFGLTLVQSVRRRVLDVCSGWVAVLDVLPWPRPRAERALAHAACFAVGSSEGVSGWHVQGC